MSMNNKYYTPSIEEFHIGFEFQKWQVHDLYYQTLIMQADINLTFIEERLQEIRVKYLDTEDIESLGFTKNISGEIPSHSNYYKLNDNKIIQITEYWSHEKLRRSNLIRIYTGVQHQYPYSEVFRGEIKNKSELKRLLKQLNIS